MGCPTAVARNTTGFHENHGLYGWTDGHRWTCYLLGKGKSCHLFIYRLQLLLNSSHV